MWLKNLFVVSSVLISFSAIGRTWYIGVKAGFGGTGIAKTAVVDDVSTEVNRSEEPGVIGISVDTMLRDDLSVSLEHRRGLRLGPISSGVGFTDLTWRWYYLRSAPVIVPFSEPNYVVYKNWAPYLGGAAGFAFGTIGREGDKVSSIDASGATIGIKLGLDYQYSANFLLRPEIIASSTFFNSSSVPATMSEFGILVGLIIPY
ncbi:MAG: hypothetical protein KDD61_11155 [Bdellovibrionales bacterium]|nr:hypothetical protein [Bdellovibrionales bacterium]